MKICYKPSDVMEWSKDVLYDYGCLVKTEKWQGIPAPDDMWEKMNHSFQMFIPKTIEELKKEIRPNLPWADEHFDERVSGIGYNPPPSHINWPYAQKDNKEFGGLQEFSHTYPERIWPKQSHNGKRTLKLRGVRFEYGDFNDVVDQLEREPFTRQAFLPIWFPEDTGAVHKERVPCTIGYHFMRRGDNLHIVYYIRSCDLIRHLRDDIYMACRKVFWLLDRLREKDPDTWNNVTPGYYTMHITSLHCFNKEKGMLKQTNI